MNIGTRVIGGNIHCDSQSCFMIHFGSKAMNNYCQ